MDEEEIVERLKKNDVYAQEYVIRKYKNFLFNSVFHVAQRSEVAQDVVEDTFIKCFKKINQFDGRSSLSTWLYRIGMNTLKNMLESEGARNRLKDRLKWKKAVNYPEEQFKENDKKKQIIWEGMKHITVIEREAITLVDIQGLNYEEASKLLAISVGTVKSRLFRAREHLRKEILKQNFFERELSKE